VTVPVEARFSLTEHHGSPVTEHTYRGHWTLVFFGFTHCRVVCPRALQRLDDAMDLLEPADADKIRALYITVDPERDTPSTMQSFLAGRPRFLGLTGTAEQIEAAKRSFRVFAAKRPDPLDPDGYAVPHTAITYVLRPGGSYADHFTDGLDAGQIGTRLRHLLHAPVKVPVHGG
jgi:protein SCO1/2